MLNKQTLDKTQTEDLLLVSTLMRQLKVFSTDKPDSSDKNQDYQWKY